MAGPSWNVVRESFQGTGRTDTYTYAAVAAAKAKPKEQLICPRCSSSRTKFCYYNNYSLTQPRYYCKTCRRYWTEGGSLRNVPVGGGTRKNKRSVLSSSSSHVLRDRPPRHVSLSSACYESPATVQQSEHHDLAVPHTTHKINSQVLEMPCVGFLPTTMSHSNALCSYNIMMQDLNPSLSFRVGSVGNWYDVHANVGSIVIPSDAGHLNSETFGKL